jgi:CheY-like chemotaxis protein
MMPILIVDDSGEDASLTSRVLGQCKVLNPVHLMKTGQECITYFERTASRAAGTIPCLVLLDLSMQPTSGIEVLRRLRDSEHAYDSIFVMLSGISDFNIIREGYQLGATTFLIKPLRTDDVVQMIQAIRGIAAARVPEGYIISPSTNSGSGSISFTSNSRSLSA